LIKIEHHNKTLLITNDDGEVKSINQERNDLSDGQKMKDILDEKSQAHYLAKQ
jgi:hypothetical protein